jgi:hypothetical protein
MANQPIDTSGKEAFYEVNVNSLAGNTAVAFVFPPQEVYNFNDQILSEYSHRPDDTIVNVDIAFLKLKIYADPDQDDAYPDGAFGATNVSGSFYAVGQNDYFYKATGSGTLTGPNLQRGTNKVTIGEAIHLPAGSEGATFANRSMGMSINNVNRFDDLDVAGLEEGHRPLGQQMTAIRLEGDDIEDVTYRCFDSTPITSNVSTAITNANLIAFSGGGPAHFTGIDDTLLYEAKNEFVHEQGGYTTGEYVSAVEIVNIERGLEDDRYGDDEDDMPFIFTGASYVFTAAEVATLESGSSVTIPNIDVWGGDCYIGLHDFKITDSTYSLTDPEKLIDGTGSKTANDDSVAKWDVMFNKFPEGGDKEDVSRPFPLKGAAQVLTVLLESEINTEMGEKSIYNSYTYNTSLAISDSNLPVPVPDQAGQIRSKFPYAYSLDYSKQNDQKLFFPYQTFSKDESTYTSRIIYSDQKIYKTDEQGFDRFRAASYYDIDETGGDLMKLIEVKDFIYGMQERGVIYIPIGSRVIETTTADNLAVRAGDIIGDPMTIDTVYGTQHPATIQTDGTSVFFVDEYNGEVCKLSGRTIEPISKLGMESYFSANLPATNKSDLRGIWDQKKREYIVNIRGSKIAVYNDILGGWVSEWDTTGWLLLGGIFANDQLYLFGLPTSGDVTLASAYTGSTVSSFFGVNSTPSISFYANPDPVIPKTFDNIVISSDDPIGGALAMTVPKPGTDQVMSPTVALTTSDIEGIYRYKAVRDASGARMRGLLAKYDVTWASGASTPIALNTILTKYRPSYKAI